MRKQFLLLAVLFSGLAAPAQTYSGGRAFDGEHMNEISVNLLGGQNVVTGWFVGEVATWTPATTWSACTCRKTAK